MYKVNLFISKKLFFKVGGLFQVGTFNYSNLLKLQLLIATSVYFCQAAALKIKHVTVRCCIDTCVDHLFW